MERSEINDKYKWKICDIFKDDESWQQCFDEALSEVNTFSQFNGKLNDMKVLHDCLKKANETSEKVSKIYVYANMKLHEDSTKSFYQGLADKAEGLITKLSAATSFIQPEILTLDFESLKANESLKMYAHYFSDLFRQKDHILSFELEQLLAETGEISASFDNIYSMLSNADMKFGTIIDEDGNEVELTHGKYVSMLESKNRKVREDAFNALYNQYINQKNTIASIYSSSVKKDVFYAKARKYNSSLEYSLSTNNIPTAVYKNLIATINEHLGDLHKYIKLRKQILGLNELKMYDLYTPIVKAANTKINYEEAKEVVLKSLEPLGKQYVEQAEKGINGGWIDVYENKGKRSGAYSWGTYGVHPFVLLNYDNKINDMFTLSHEMGHAMHSYYSWNTQPYVYSGHTIFLAEVASTVNEALLMEHLLKTTKDEVQNKYLINYFIEQFRGTVFRQTMFAEFELKTHELAESGVPLDVDLLCNIYAELNKKYYGDAISYDEKIPMEWSRIPHFYSPFYVFQYATGFSAAIALSKQILQGNSERYINFLKSGSSNYSIEILKQAGVDMTSSEPIKSALSLFSELVSKLS